MEIAPNTALPEVSFSLPIYASETIAEAKGNDGEEFEITIGLGKKAAEEIKSHALDENDEELLKNTSDCKRFGEGSYEEWYSKGRMPFGLIHKKTGALAAFFYGGQKELDGEPGEWHTFGYRSYKPFRGKGLMKDFSKFAMKIYSEKYPGARYWLRVTPGNEASLALASSLGFSVSEKHLGDAESLILVK